MKRHLVIPSRSERFAAVALALAACVALAGCIGAPAPRTYILGQPDAGPATARLENGRPVVLVRRVSVPDYLDTTDIVVRQGSNEIAASRTGRWGERLSLGVTHALVSALAARLPDMVVTATAFDDRQGRQLLVDLVRFEIEADGRCILRARWSVDPPGSRQGSDAFEVRQGAGGGPGPGRAGTELDDFVIQAASLQDADVAAAMTRAVDALADRIASALR